MSLASFSWSTGIAARQPCLASARELWLGRSDTRLIGNGKYLSIVITSSVCKRWGAMEGGLLGLQPDQEVIAGLESHGIWRRVLILLKPSPGGLAS